MRLVVSLNELEGFISSVPSVRSHVKDMHLNVIDNRHLDADLKLCMSIPIVGEVSTGIKLIVHILEVGNNILRLEVSTRSSMVNMLASKVLQYTKERFEEAGFVELNGGTIVSVHLERIEKLRPALENFTLNDLTLEEGSAVVDFSYAPGKMAQ